MKLLYNDTDGKIFYAVYDADWFKFQHSTNITLTEYTIDEIDPTNKEICFDISRSVGKVDSSGLGKYYIDDDGDLAERDGWEEAYNG